MFVKLERCGVQENRQRPVRDQLLRDHRFVGADGGPSADMCDYVLISQAIASLDLSLSRSLIAIHVALGGAGSVRQIMKSWIAKESSEQQHT